MALVVRGIHNAGQPIVSPTGNLLAGITIVFQLVNAQDEITDVIDATTFERVGPVEKTVVTDANGEFPQVSLWPNDRGEIPTFYRVIVKSPGFRSFRAALPSDVLTPISWIDFKMQGSPLNATDLSALRLYLAEIEANVVSASDAADAAAVSASSAAGAAVTASTKAGEASASATTAAGSASTANTQATNATNSATAAAGSAATANTKANEAATSATAAAGSATTASVQATNAATSATTAAGGATAAATKADEAAASATAAAGSATTANTKASEASVSAASAAGAATNAASSATSASTSESTATAKASEANGSAVTASNAAVSAQNSAASVQAASAALASHLTPGGNPHGTTKADLGLGNVIDREQQVYHGIESAGALSYSSPGFVTTLNLAGPIVYWYKGQKVTVAGPLTLDLMPLSSEALIYVYFDDTSGVLKGRTTPIWNIFDHVMVATVWNSGWSAAIIKETHSYRRDLEWHQWAHNNIGSRIKPNEWAMTAPSAALPGTIDLAGGSLWDEDQLHSYGRQQIGRTWHQTTGGLWTQVDADTWVFPGATVQYVRTDNNYALTNVASNNYINVWIYAAPDTARPVYSFIESKSGASAYSTIAAARAIDPPLLAGFGLSPEMRLLYRVIYRGNSTVSEVTDYRNVSSIPAGGVTAQSAGAVSFVPGGNISATNVQAALEELDAEKQLKTISSVFALMAAASLAGTTNETVMFTATIPAGTLGPNSVIRVSYDVDHSSGTNSRYWIIKVGGQTSFSTGNYTSITRSGGWCEVKNKNVANAQSALQVTRHSNGLGIPSYYTLSVDTSVDVTVQLLCKLAVAGDVAYLLGGFVEVIK